MKKPILAIPVLVLFFFLASGCGISSVIVPPTATPQPDAYVGEWKGTTDQGYEIRLVVKMNGGVAYIVEVGYRIDSDGWNSDPRGPEAWTMENPSALFEHEIPIGEDGCFINNPEWMLELTGCFSGSTVSGKLAGRPESVGWVRAGDKIVLGGDFIGETDFTATQTNSLMEQVTPNALFPSSIFPTQTSLMAEQTITPAQLSFPPDLLGTPVYVPAEAISLENAARVIELANWGNGTLSTMALSPNGQTLAVAGSIGVSLYNADTLVLRDSLSMDESVNELAFSPDGQTLVLGLSHRVLLWDLPEDTIDLFDLSEIGSINKISSLAYSPNGKWLAIGTQGRATSYSMTDDIEGGTYVFETTTGKLVTTLNQPGTSISATGLAFSPDSQVLAIAEAELELGKRTSAHHIRFWATTTWELKDTFEGEAGIERSADLAFSPDGKTLAFPSTWTYIWLLNLVDESSVKPTAETDSYYFHVTAISPDGRTVAAGGYYGLLTLWDTATGKTLLTLQNKDLPLKRLIFSPEGKRLYAASTDGIRVWNTSTGDLIHSAINHTSFGKVISFSPDGKRLATLRGDEIIIWDASSGSRLQTFAGHNYAAFSPDWSHLATVSLGDQLLWLYDLNSGNRIPALDRGERQAVEAMFFSPDGKLLAQVESGDDPQLLLWDTASGSLLRSIKDASNFLAFTPDGKSFATLNIEITEPSPTNNIPEGKVLRYLYVTFWDTANGSQGEKILVGGGEDNFNGLVFLPDKNSFIVQIDPLLSDVTLSKWERSEGSAGWSKLWTLETDNSSCPLDCSMTLSPDGAMLTLGNDGNSIVTLVDVLDGKLLATLVGHNNNSDALADYTYNMEGQVFSPDGKQLVTSGEDGLLFFWGVRP